MIAALTRIHPEAHPSLISVAGVPVRADVFYTNAKGQEKKDVRKRAERDIGQLQYILRRVLDREEAVLYVARCEVRPSLIEQLTVGFYARYFSRITLVITNHRLLYFFVNRDRGWKQSLRVARWGDIETARIKTWINRTLTVRFHSGQKEAYWRIRRADASKIRLLLAAILPAAGGMSSAESPVSLCPECLTILTPGRYLCGVCGMRFKDEETLLRRVLLVPGGGYFYTGQTSAGILQLVADLYLIATVISSIIFYQRAPAAGDVIAAPGRQDTAYLATAALFGAGLVLEKWGAFYHCRKVIRRFIPLQESHKV